MRLVGALRPGFYPGLDERARLFLRARRRLPAIAGRPAPTDQMILADMLNERVECAVSVAGRIFDLGANLAEILPSMPFHATPDARSARPARLPVEVGLQVAGGAAAR